MHLLLIISLNTFLGPPVGEGEFGSVLKGKWLNPQEVEVSQK